MTTALGVLCKKDEVFLAAVRDGELVVNGPERLAAPALLEQTDRLEAMLDDLSRTIAAVKPDVVRVLLPEQTYKDSYLRIAPRAALETLVRLAALREGVKVEMLRRITARSRLKMPRSGTFESHISTAITAPIGKYWHSGRNLAVAAAFADD